MKNTKKESQENTFLPPEGKKGGVRRHRSKNDVDGAVSLIPFLFLPPPSLGSLPRVEHLGFLIHLPHLLSLPRENGKGYIYYMTGSYYFFFWMRLIGIHKWIFFVLKNPPFCRAFFFLSDSPGGKGGGLVFMHFFYFLFLSRKENRRRLL